MVNSPLIPPILPVVKRHISLYQIPPSTCALNQTEKEGVGGRVLACEGLSMLVTGPARDRIYFRG